MSVVSLNSCWSQWIPMLTRFHSGGKRVIKTSIKRFPVAYSSPLLFNMLRLIFLTLKIRLNTPISSVAFTSGLFVCCLQLRLDSSPREHLTEVVSFALFGENMNVWNIPSVRTQSRGVGYVKFVLMLLPSWKCVTVGVSCVWHELKPHFKLILSAVSI